MGTIIRSPSALSSLVFPCILRFRFCCSPFCWQYPICCQSLFFHFSFTAIWFPVSTQPSIPKAARWWSPSGRSLCAAALWHSRCGRRQWHLDWIPFHKVMEVPPQHGAAFASILGWPRWNGISCHHQFLWNGYKAIDPPARKQFNSLCLFLERMAGSWLSALKKLSCCERVGVTILGICVCTKQGLEKGTICTQTHCGQKKTLLSLLWQNCS